jgi:L-fucose mutarotase/ribose pyranase (RbsD/FucU family)
MMTRAGASSVGWEKVLLSRLPLYGHRNWIVVADSAYPAQSQPAIETILADADQLSVVQTVLAAIRNSPHTRANIYTDQELRYVREEDAAGITQYRLSLAQLLDKNSTSELPHETIIAKLDRAAQMFRVLIVKTDMTIPYSSVFLELNCAYWSSEAEIRLRSTIPNSITQ